MANHGTIFNACRDPAAVADNLDDQELLGNIVEADASSAAAGLAVAVVAGIAGGLILFPMKFVPQDLQGLAYLPSMSLGVLLAAPVCLVMQRMFPLALSGAQQFKVACAPGTLSGIIWNVGNLCSIAAVQHVRLTSLYVVHCLAC